MRLHAISLCVVFTCTLPSSPASAGPVDRALSLAGDFGFGGVGGKAYTTIQTGLDIQEGNLTLGLFGRVRILIQESDNARVVRERDWDEPSDYVHILRYLQYQRTFGSVTVKARVGEMLGVTLGHGTLLRDYANVSDPDHPHSGLRFAVSHEMFDVVGLVDNFIRPGVVATRAAARPFKSLRAFELGASMVLDPTAPLQVRTEDHSAHGDLRQVDSAWNLQADTEVLCLLGLDASYTFGDTKRGQLTPYLDVNTSLLGAGVHLGAKGRVPLGKSKARISFQVEYRGGSAGYAPGHVDTFYDVSRHQAGLTFSQPRQATVQHRTPMLAGLARGAYGGHGVLAQTALSHKRLGSLKLGYTHRPGPDTNNLWIRLSARPWDRLTIGALVYLRGLGGPHDDANGVVALAEGRVRITDNLYGLAQYTRSWYLEPDTRYYGIMQSFNLSVGANWSR